MQAGQGNPEPSPHDRRLFNRKVRHVGDRVAGIIARTPEIADQAAALIKVEYEPQGAVYTVEEAMAEGAPLVHNGEVIYNAGAPADLAEYNKLAGDEREGKVVYQFPLGADIHKNIAASNKGGIGDMEKGFAEADAIVERTYQTSQIQHTPLEPHVCYAHIEGGRLVLNCATQVPYHVRRIVSWVCGIPENKIHVIKERVGGGYGSKQDILVEDLTGLRRMGHRQARLLPQYPRRGVLRQLHPSPHAREGEDGRQEGRHDHRTLYGGLRQHWPLRQPLPDRSDEQLLQDAAALCRGQHGV